MRTMIVGLAAASLLLVTAPAFAACELTAADLAARRATYEAACAALDPPRGCATARNHGQYVSCIGKEARADATLPMECRGAITRCASRSTCGKPGAVTCCRTKPDGATRCSTKRDASSCSPPVGGSACTGSFSSCCDACTDSGCAAP